ncbi:MAG: ATP-dependent DNA ligase [Archaeoglobaceae archaeon]|nr:ATP-dependent DNA ligase [Archaeoglobaceae archaeon]MCX8151603.1 ATP-dependent DNA ligase [Archaeoglobaceae archaeon]MDW8013119.1 ATP-dependent DNA ligase [Archaeoglobaceae archaeon]
MLFRDFAEFCSTIEKISSTLELAARVSVVMKKLSDDDLYNFTLFLMGRVFPTWDERDLGVGIGMIYEALEDVSGIKKERIEDYVRELGDLGLAAEKVLKNKKISTLASEELTIKRIRETFNEIAELSGEGSRKKKTLLLTGLFTSASPIEARYLVRIILKEMRLGVGEGIIRDAIARAFNVPVELVERAYMVTNDLGKVAVIAKNNGKSGLESVKIEPHIPVKMMLAQNAESAKEAVEEIGEVAVEWKFDGSRIQVHYANGKVTIYSRRLENVTNAIPEIAEAVKKNVEDGVILDGEVIAVKDGKPMPFQQVLRRFRRKHDISKMMEKISLQVYFFDILYKDGELINLPLKERRKILEKVVSENEIVKIADQVVTKDPEKVEEIFKASIDAGHEGVMIKDPNSLYIPGRRGKHWLKLKTVMETLDLAVVGGEWGEGKRSKWFSSFELACKDPITEKLLRVGKVATGFTDEDLEELTELFKPLIIRQIGKRVDFVPKYVFEVAYQEIQKSPKYESGFALRFPRFVRLRDDKSVEEIDTVDRIDQLFARQVT